MLLLIKLSINGFWSRVSATSWQVNSHMAQSVKGIFHNLATTNVSNGLQLIYNALLPIRPKKQQLINHYNAYYYYKVVPKRYI